MKTLAAAVADAHDFAAPYVFLGHSLGALTAHEVTGLLLDRGAPAPLHLIASGSPAPHLPPLKEPARHLPDRELAALLGRQHSPLPAEILADPEVLRLSLRAFRADLTVLETREPSPSRTHRGRCPSPPCAAGTTTYPRSTPASGPPTPPASPTGGCPAATSPSVTTPRPTARPSTPW